MVLSVSSALCALHTGSAGDAQGDAVHRAGGGKGDLLGLFMTQADSEI